MCGIAGRLNFNGAPVVRAELEAARDALANRGPDDAGIWLDGAVGLALGVPGFRSFALGTSQSTFLGDDC